MIQTKLRDKRGNEIVLVAVREQAFKDCDGPSSHPFQLWFYRDQQGSTRPLPGQLNGGGEVLMFPLAFSDLIDDGGNEVLFLVAGYNRGGYALYYDEFRKRAVFTWEYH